MAKGRKSRYETHIQPHLEKIKMWRREGYYEEQMAQILGVGVSTWHLYKTQHQEMVDALKTGKEDLVAELEKTLFQRAKGMEYEEVKTIVEKDDQGRDKKKIEKVKKWLAPDTTALIFSLKNLKPEQWRDRHEVKHEGDLNITFVDDLE
jgi:hypothetical protein